MKTGMALATFALFVGSAAPAPAEMYGAEYQACSGGSTAAIVDCVGARAKAWDARLNAGFKGAMTRMDAGQRDQLRAAQRLWIQYRDANCAFYGRREGSLAQIEAAECLRSMTEERARELETAGTN